MLNVPRRVTREDRAHVYAPNKCVPRNVDVEAVTTKKKVWRPSVDAVRGKRKPVIFYLAVTKLENVKRNVPVSKMAVIATESANALTAAMAAARRIVSHLLKEEPKR